MSEKKLETFNVLNFLDNGYELDYIIKEGNFSAFSSPEELIDYLVGEGYLLEKSDDEEVLTFDILAKKYTVSELKDLLRKHNLKVSGNKQTLIERILPVLKGLNLNSLDSFDESKEYELTDKAKEFLKENQWIDLYTFALIMFRFEDYEIYAENSSENMIGTALNFCDEVLSRSLMGNQFQLFLFALTAKAHVYAYDNDFESFLNYDLQRFILGLNPFTMDSETYAKYEILDYANVVNLKNISEKFNVGRLKTRFDKIWAKSNIKDVTVPKKTSFKYLKRAIEGADIEELNFELREKYFNKKFGI